MSLMKRNIILFLSVLLTLTSVFAAAQAAANGKEKKYLFRSERPVVRFTPEILAQLRQAQEKAEDTRKSSSAKVESGPAVPYNVPFSVLFKYDTSPNNPEHRCYEITKPITRQMTFLFNFMSLQQYRVNPL